MNRIKTLPKYLKYKIFSSHKRGHGIHSPFVFTLITEVFRNKIDPGIVSNIEKIRKKMLTDDSVIHVTDYGSGSKHLKNRMRKVSSIVRYSSVSSKYGKMLNRLAGRFGGENIIELGTSLGISSMYMASGAPSATVHTVEGCREISEIASKNFNEAGFKNIKSYTGKFDEVLNILKEQNITPGLVFIDGDHRKESLMKYFSILLEMCTNDSVIVVDDIHTTPEMYEAWQEIKEMKNVSITIDIFRMGILFFRKGIAKFDYVIRY